MSAAVSSEGEAQSVKQGEFKDADSFHRGSGQAIIYTTPGGGHLLRLENLSVTNGPALHVILSSHPDPARPDEVKEGDYVDLGRLKGNRGNQNYAIPADVDVLRLQQRRDLLQALLRRLQHGPAPVRLSRPPRLAAALRDSVRRGVVQ